MKRKKEHSLTNYIWDICLFAVLLGGFFLALYQMEQKNEQRNLVYTQQAITKAVATCYAVEGIYPPDIDYLKDHYGLHYNEKLFFVDYTIYASNIMPDITILPIRGGGYQ